MLFYGAVSFSYWAWCSLFLYMCSLTSNSHIVDTGEALTRKGHIHSKWHTDVITAPCRRSASVWIGAENINKKTILKVIRNSHDLGVTVQALVPPPVAQEYQSGETDTFKEEGEKLLGYAKTFYETADIVESEMVEGDVLIFQGSTWHGTTIFVSFEYTASSKQKFLITIPTLWHAGAINPTGTDTISRFM